MRRMRPAEIVLAVVVVIDSPAVLDYHDEGDEGYDGLFNPLKALKTRRAGE